MHPERAHLEQSLASQILSNAKLGSGLQAAVLSYSSWVLRAVRMKIFLFCFCITVQFSLLKEGSTRDKLRKCQRSRLQASQTLPCLLKQQAACPNTNSRKRCMAAVHRAVKIYMKPTCVN